MPGNFTLVEKYKTMGVDLTENGFNSASFELNGDCWTGLFSRTEKKVELDENNHCDGLITKGTWVVWFDKVSMHGSAKCEYEHAANFEYSCSCKIDKIEKPYDMLVAKNTPWVKDFVVYTTQQECDALCTKRCSEHVGHLQNIREEMMVGF